MSQIHVSILQVGQENSIKYELGDAVNDVNRINMLEAGVLCFPFPLIVSLKTLGHHVNQ